MNVSQLCACRDLPPSPSTFLAGSTVGTIVRTYFALVNNYGYMTTTTGAHSSSTGGPEDTHFEVPLTSNTPRAMYMAAMSARPPNEPASEATTEFARRLRTARIWECLTRDLIALATARKPPSVAEKEEGQTDFERLVLEDKCTEFDIPSHWRGSRATPLSNWSEDEVVEILKCWYGHHPFGFLLNDALLLDQLNKASYDPALLSFVLGSEVVSYTSSTEQSNRGAILLAYSQSTLFDRLVTPVNPTTGVLDGLTIGTIQTLTFWALHEMSLVETRRAWSLFSTAHLLARDLFRTRVSVTTYHPGRPPTPEQVETETLSKIIDTISSYLSWTCLELGLPPAALTELAKSPSPLSSLNPSTPVPHLRQQPSTNAISHLKLAVASPVSSPGMDWRRRSGPLGTIATAGGAFALKCALAHDDAATILGLLFATERAEAEARATLGSLGPVLRIAGQFGADIGGIRAGGGGAAEEEEEPIYKFNVEMAEHLLGRAWLGLNGNPNGEPTRQELFVPAVW
jgi:hypothetical protein